MPSLGRALPSCAVCGALSKFKCTRCGQACYCCAEHQREAWKDHKVECKRLCAEAEAAKGSGPNAKAEAAKGSAPAPKVEAAKGSAPAVKAAETKGGGPVSKTTQEPAKSSAKPKEPSQIVRQGIISECVKVRGQASSAEASLRDGLCFYINLDRRPDRRKRMEALTSPHSWLSSSLQRIPAVDGRELNWRRCARQETDVLGSGALVADAGRLRGAARRGRGRRHDARGAPGPEEGPCHLTLGGCGCALSHVKAWQNLVDRGSSWALILEDDLVGICDNFDEELGIALGRLPTGWLICYLGFHSPEGPEQRLLAPGRHPEGPFKMSEEGGWLAGLWCYVISKAGAELFLRECVPLKAQVDAVAGILAVEAGACYCLCPGEFLAFSKPTEVSRDTDIQTFPEEMKK